MSVLLGLLFALADGPPPTYLVERVVHVNGEVRRVSVFRDGSFALAWSRPGQEKTVLRRTLLPSELDVMVQVVGESYSEVSKQVGLAEGAGSALVELRVAPPGREPVVVRYPLESALNLVASRLCKALDELEAVLLSGKPVREDLRRWQPQVGEWVELEDGRLVSIIESLEAGAGLIYRLQIGDGPASVYMPAEELRRLAVRRVQR